MPRNIFVSLLSLLLKEYFLEATTSLTQGAPGIVVGQLQHMGRLPSSFCNDLKQVFNLADVQALGSR
jgi:hypothetical protein